MGTREGKQRKAPYTLLLLTATFVLAESIQQNALCLLQSVQEHTLPGLMPHPEHLSSASLLKPVEQKGLQDIV